MTESPTALRVVPRRLHVHALFRMPELVGTVPGLAGTTLATGIDRVERHPIVALQSVYHDTEDLRLIRWGVTLLRRSGGDQEGWLLRLPTENAGSGPREQVHLPLDAGVPGEVPEVLADAVTALTRRNRLLPVATLHTDRSTLVLHSAGGGPIAELVDDVVSIVDGQVVAARFRELQITALTGDVDALDPIVDLLMSHGAMPGASSKAASALGPAARAEPDVAAPFSVSPQDPAGAAVHAHLLTHVRRFLLQDIRVRLDLPDSVHQMRVAGRRLRSGLRAFSPLVDPQWSRHLRDELGWAASELGLSRDSEVLLARLDAHGDELGAADAALIHAHIDPLMQARVDAGRTESLAALRSERHLDLLEALVDAAANPRLTPAAAAPARDVLPPLFDKAWRKLAREVGALALDGPSEQWHETRITAKRARYAAEVLVPVFGAPARNLATALSTVTEQLGENQDAAIAQATCRELAGNFDGRTGFALGLLHAYEVECELVARIRMKEQWPVVMDQRTQNWLG